MTLEIVIGYLVTEFYIRGSCNSSHFTPLPTSSLDADTWTHITGNTQTQDGKHIAAVIDRRMLPVRQKIE